MILASVFGWNDHGIGLNLTCMISTGIIVFMILVVIEMGAFRSIIAYAKNNFPFNKPTIVENDEPIDDDVAAAKQHIDSMSPVQLKQEIMVLQNVSKYYGSFVAVNDVSLLVKRYVFSIVS